MLLLLLVLLLLLLLLVLLLVLFVVLIFVFLLHLLLFVHVDAAAHLRFVVWKGCGALPLDALCGRARGGLATWVEQAAGAAAAASIAARTHAVARFAASC